MKFRQINFHDQSEMTEIIESYSGVDYHLIPDHHHVVKSLMEIQHRYRELSGLSVDKFTRRQTLIDSTLKKDAIDIQRNVLPKDLAEFLIRQSSENPNAITHQSVIDKLLPLILTEKVDQQITSFFGSEYCLFWYSYLVTEPKIENRAFSSYWHCDKGPENHLKMLIYLNDYEEHGGNTLFYDVQTTDKLKSTGYIFGDINKRVENLAPLADAKSIILNEISFNDIKAGDALLFAPCKVAHKGKIPNKNARHVLQLCFIPSPLDWKTTSQKILQASPYISEFEGAAEKILNYFEEEIDEDSNSVVVPLNGEINCLESLKWALDNIYSDSSYSELICNRIVEIDPGFQNVNSIESLIETLKLSFEQSINWQGELLKDDIFPLKELVSFESQYKVSRSCYNKNNETKRSAIFWPMPDHNTHPASKYNELPYIKKEPLVDKSTSIGSAGSCFAFEIARVLQENGFNYLITERNDNQTSGMIVDGYKSGDKFAKFNANYGILFNTPSFKQLAQRAFGYIKTKKILFQQDEYSWVDPYRENVLFLSKQAYLDDYNNHLAAVRYLFENVEVFIITLGLNECWQFHDGTVMSRNPRSTAYPYVKHKVLTVQENVDNIQTFFNIIKQHNPKFKLIVSVSPIPMLATGRADELHVISANTHSKAVLRVAVDTLVNNNEDIFYLPSYELVNDCIEEPWCEDTRHVKEETVKKVVNMFEEIFSKEN